MVERIHASGRRIVLAISGGGSAVIAELLRVPGGSRTLVEAIVPYGPGALVDFLGHEPEQACSVETAVAMAQRARERAAKFAPTGAQLVGLGATAGLVTDRPRQGEHRLAAGRMHLGDRLSPRRVGLALDSAGIHGGGDST